MLKVNKQKTDILYGYVRKDLEASILAIFWRIGVSFFVGGLLSMFFCGQFGIGFSALAKGWNHAIHAHMGAVQCAILCGVTFSVIPVLILRALCSGVLFRKILQQYSVTTALLILIAGSVMYYGGAYMNEVLNICVWSMSSFIGFKLMGFIVEKSMSMFSRSAETL